jgi:hypothetical protein
VVVDAFNADGVQTYRIGPAKFTLDADGVSGSVTAQAVYVGPGSDATGVALSPRSVAVTLRSTGSGATCTPMRGASAITGFVPLRVHSANANVAVASFVKSGGSASNNAILVFGTGPGTTRIFCELGFGTHAQDSISVSVSPTVGTQTLVFAGAGAPTLTVVATGR